MPEHPGIEAIAEYARRAALAVTGAFHPGPEDGVPVDCGTLVLLGPDEPGFWPHFCTSPEGRDGAPDPIDRWSRRVIRDLAATFGGVAVFPFDGPPWLPFTAWAQRTGRVWTSPVGMLVHDETGLFFSCRGAMALPQKLALAAASVRPCDTCAAPCLDACPPRALTCAGYDVPACHGFLDTAAGMECMARGCAVRRACPVGMGRRLAAQSAYQMAQFHGKAVACDG